MDIKPKLMNKKHLTLKSKYVLLILIFFICYLGHSQERIFYKQVDSVKLYLKIFYPDTIGFNKKNYPTILFFHGGGWRNGSSKQLNPHAKYFSQRGMISILVDYRTESKHQTTPFESLKDAKSAMRFAKKNAIKYKIDTTQIVAAGASSGGHLAAATALIDDYNENTDDISIDATPDALVLFNPVIDNGPGGYGYERIGKAYKSFSPLHNLKSGAPPTVLFLGTNDHLIPVETVKYYQKVMQNVGSECKIHLFQGQSHGFFNYRNFIFYSETILKTDEFLQSLGFLKDIPIVKIN